MRYLIILPAVLGIYGLLWTIGLFFGISWIQKANVEGYVTRGFFAGIGSISFFKLYTMSNEHIIRLEYGIMLYNMEFGNTITWSDRS